MLAPGSQRQQQAWRQVAALTGVLLVFGEDTGSAWLVHTPHQEETQFHVKLPLFMLMLLLYCSLLHAFSHLTNT